MAHELLRQNIDKQAVADSFSKAAKYYDQFAQLQRDIGEQLLTQITNSRQHSDTDFPLHIVDLGCGTGYFSEKLNTLFPVASMACFDLSFAMLDQVKKRKLSNTSFQQGDIDAPNFVGNSIDLIYSNLVVQWSGDLQHCLSELHKSLTKGGRAYISTLISGTLDELTQAWKAVDENPHTNTFMGLPELNTIIDSVQFNEINITTETRVLEYNNVIEVMRALKGIGANHVHGHQVPKISGRQLLKQLQVGYQPFINDRGLLNLTYQVCYIEVVK